METPAIEPRQAIKTRLSSTLPTQLQTSLPREEGGDEADAVAVEFEAADVQFEAANVTYG